jgi:hypothetical protein
MKSREIVPDKIEGGGLTVISQLFREGIRRSPQPFMARFYPVICRRGKVHTCANGKLPRMAQRHDQTMVDNPLISVLC